MAAQEISMQTGEILERVNAFMDGKVFVRVQVQQRLGRAGLNERRPPKKKRFPPPRLDRPQKLGSLLDSLPQDSPVGRCYRAYIDYFIRTADADEQTSASRHDIGSAD